MNLNDLRDLITQSDPDAWHVLDTGPTNHTEFMAWTSPPDDSVNLEVNTHNMSAVFIADVSVSVAWGMEVDFAGLGSRREGRTFKWAQNFIDKVTHAIYADVYLSGALVDREYLLTVDGGRCYLPFPETRVAHRDAALQPDAWYDAVTPWQRGLTRLVDELAHGGQSRFDEYIERAGFTIEV